MIPLGIYKVVHLLGVLLAVGALSGACAHALAGPAGSPPVRRLLLTLHGLGVALILLGGFGMLARLGGFGGPLFPGWVWVKIALWMALATFILFPHRVPGSGRVLLVLAPLLGAAAGALGVFKPF